MAGDLAGKLASAEPEYVSLRIEAYERLTLSTLASFVDTPENRESLARLDAAHRQLLARIDAEVDRLAKGMASQRRNGRLVNSYFAASSAQDQHSRSA